MGRKSNLMRCSGESVMCARRIEYRDDLRVPTSPLRFFTFLIFTDGSPIRLLRLYEFVAKILLTGLVKKRKRQKVHFVCA